MTLREAIHSTQEAILKNNAAIEVDEVFRKMLLEHLETLFNLQRHTIARVDAGKIIWSHSDERD